MPTYAYHSPDTIPCLRCGAKMVVAEEFIHDYEKSRKNNEIPPNVNFYCACGNDIWLNNFLHWANKNGRQGYSRSLK